MRKNVLAGVSVCLGLLAPLCAGEIILRFLPVNEGLRAQAVNAQQPVFHFQPNRTSQFSEHWNFDIVNQVLTNNYGFVNDFDYDPDARTPLLAIVGDSYIEAAMVPFKETLQGTLAAKVGARGRVYSFAASGAPLSQYLVWAEFARTEFRPNGLLVNIVGNDFDESWLGHGGKPCFRKPGFHLFHKSHDGSVRLVREDYTPSLAHRLTRDSALAMYLLANLKLYAWYKQVRWSDFLPNVSQGYVAEVLAQSAGLQVKKTEWAADVFLEELPARSGLDPSRILFTIDGFRPQMYSPEQLPAVSNSGWAEIRRYFIEKASEAGYEVIDLHPVFMERYSRDHRRFEFPTDAHWNGEGHTVVADAVMSSRVFGEVFRLPLRDSMRDGAAGRL